MFIKWDFTAFHFAQLFRGLYHAHSDLFHCEFNRMTFLFMFKEEYVQTCWRKCSNVGHYAFFVQIILQHAFAWYIWYRFHALFSCGCLLRLANSKRRNWKLNKKTRIFFNCHLAVELIFLPCLELCKTVWCWYVINESYRKKKYTIVYRLKITFCISTGDCHTGKHK